MTIIRTYRCNDCSEVFEVTLEHGDMGDPDCPYCAIEMQWQPRPFHITSNKAKAVDIAQKSIEADFGLTDFNDRTKEGETVAMAPKALTTAQHDTVMQQTSEIAQQLRLEVKQEVQAVETPRHLKGQVEGFWSGSQAGPPAGATSAFLAGAKQGPEADIGIKTLEAMHKKGRELGISAVPRVIRPG